MGSDPNLREKCLVVKEKWAIVLTRITAVCYRHGFNAPVFCPLPRSPPECGSARIGVVVVLGLD
jgi:hypothetical protein